MSQENKHEQHMETIFSFEIFIYLIDILDHLILIGLLRYLMLIIGQLFFIELGPLCCSPIYIEKS